MGTEGKEKKKTKNKYFDYNLLTIVVFLMCFGLVMLYSTSSYSAQLKFGDGMYYFKKQALISAGSIFIMLFVSKIDYHIYARWATYIFWGAFGMMLLVRTPLGVEAYGAKRWIRLPLGLTMQPSEVMKIAIIVLIPLLICKEGKHIKEWKTISKVLLWGIGLGEGNCGKK